MAVTVATGTANAGDLINIRSNTTGNINGSALSAINGTSSAIVDAYVAMTIDPTNFNSEVTGEALASKLINIQSFNGAGIVDVSGATSITGTASNIVSIINNNVEFNLNGHVDLIVTDNASYSQASKIYNTISTGDTQYSVEDGRALETADANVLSHAHNVIYNGSASANIMDMSFYTLNNLTINGLGGNDTITGSLGNDTINGGSGNDVITGLLGNDVFVGGSGNDTYIFADSASDNGLDTVEFSLSGIMLGTDVMNFSQFLGLNSTIPGVDVNGGSSGQIIAHTAGETASKDITGLVTFINNASAMSATDIANLFGAGKPFSIQDDGKAVILVGNSAGSHAQVFFVDQSLGGAGVTAADVALVANTSNNVDIALLKTQNFAVI